MAIQQLNATGGVAVSTPAGSPAPPARPAPAAPVSPSPAAALPIAPDQLKAVVEEVKQMVEPVAQNLQFSIDDDTGRTVVRVVDSATKEVIRQIPAEELLAIARSFDRLQGLLLHKKA